ncbi:immunity 53 family protein [Schlesneria sp. DSM 10557]|uniref:immunity 53 family protein n=1 Tax=Schlesneria sp. DSM 10557 TaxID=3044399 RepID=UPI00359F3763
MTNRKDPFVRESSVIDISNLVKWYHTHCNGDWEQKYGIKLETLDNPGWQLTVDLIHTDLQGRELTRISEGCSPDGHPRSPRWIHCGIQNNQFQGACSPSQLERLLQIFTQLLAPQNHTDSNVIE